MFLHADMVTKGAFAAIAGERAITSRTSMPAARTAAIVAGACLSVALAACSSPSNPSVSVASARPVSPVNAAQVAYNTQPVKLLVDNGVATGGGRSATRSRSRRTPVSQPSSSIRACSRPAVDKPRSRSIRCQAEASARGPDEAFHAASRVPAACPDATRSGVTPYYATRRYVPACAMSESSS
jgi:hypothetical protein